MFQKPINCLGQGMSEGFSGNKTLLDDSNTWEFLYDAQRKNKIIQGSVRGVEPDRSGGIVRENLIIFIGSIKGVILPDEIGEPRPKYLSALIGAPVAFKVKQCARSQGVAYLSRKDALAEMAGATWEELKKSCEELVQVLDEMNALRPEEGQEPTEEVRHRMQELGRKAIQVGPVRTATVRSVVKEGAYMDIGGVSAYLTVRDMSWGRVEDARELVRPGMSFDVRVTRVDFENAYVRVNLRTLLPDPWTHVQDRYKKDGRYNGVISRYTNNGKLVVELEPGISAICPTVSEQEYTIGDTVNVRLNIVNLEKRYITGVVTGLSRWVHFG